MGLPAKKTPKSKTRSRRAHLALKKVRLLKCPKCKKAILPHHACSFCGTYRGREVKTIKDKINRKFRRRKLAHKKKAEEETPAEETKKASSFRLQR